jgi:hypothetical protein
MHSSWLTHLSDELDHSLMFKGSAMATALYDHQGLSVSFELEITEPRSNFTTVCGENRFQNGY